MSNSIKTTVINRAKNCCEYCLSQTEYSSDPFSIDHIIPRSKNGSDELDNLAWACLGCNGHKYNTTECPDPASGLIVSLYNPRHNNWNEHFIWSEDYLTIIGITEIGRATVEKLQLNRTGVVNLRNLLFQVGLHPPF